MIVRRKTSIEGVLDRLTRRSLAVPGTPLGAEGSGRVVRGWISAAGEVKLGSGFTVTKPEAIRYQVHFTVPFENIPVVMFSPVNGTGVGGNILAFDENGFTLDLYGVGMSRVESAFTFRAEEVS